MPAPGAGPNTKVRVVGRIRPLAKYELERGAKETLISLVGPNKKDPEVYSEEPEMIQVTEEGGNKRYFELDAVFDKDCTQREVYVRSGCLKAVTEDLFNGYNCTVLAYGQTGAGKSFSMGTASHSSEITETDGMIPRACHDLFETIRDKCDGNAKVLLQYIEIYNEELRDLLVDDADIQPLKIRETVNGEVYIAGLEAKEVKSPQDIGALMEEASGRRIVAATAMNAVSSRSHAMCVLKVEGVVETNDGSDKFSAKLTLVDLAGSERASKTGATGARLKEGVNINKSLLVLGQVVSALATKDKKRARKPPYRDSKLTRLLQDSLGGNSQTIMVACASPADYNSEESINTMRYATSARNIKNTATKNVVKNITPEEAAKLQRENQLLKKQVTELQASIKVLNEEAAASTKATTQIAETESTDSTASTVVSSISDADEKVDELHKRIEELERDNRRLRRKYENDSESGQNSNRSISDLIERDEKVGEQNERIQMLLREAEEKEAKLEEQNRGMEELEKDNRRLQRKLEKKEAETAAKSTADLEERDEKIKEQNKRIEKLKRDGDEKEEKIDEHSQMIEELKRDNERLKKKLEKESKSDENSSSSNSNVEEKEEKINEQQERIEKITKDNQRLQKRMRKTEKTLDEMDQHIAELEKENKRQRKALRIKDEIIDEGDEIIEEKCIIIEELEEDLQRLQMSMQSTSTRSLGQSASSTVFEVERLREELREMEGIEEDNRKLQDELEMARIDADCALRAAARMSDMLEERDQGSGGNINGMELEIKKKEEQWITFVLQILDTSCVEIRKLETDFELVMTLAQNMIASTSSITGDQLSGSRRTGLFGFGGGADTSKHDTKVRIEMLNDQVKFFPESIMKIEKNMEEEANSLREIKNDLKKVTDTLRASNSSLPNEEVKQ